MSVTRSNDTLYIASIIRTDNSRFVPSCYFDDKGDSHYINDKTRDIIANISSSKTCLITAGLVYIISHCNCGLEIKSIKNYETIEDRYYEVCI